MTDVALAPVDPVAAPRPPQRNRRPPGARPITPLPDASPAPPDRYPPVEACYSPATAAASPAPTTGPPAAERQAGAPAPSPAGRAGGQATRTPPVARLGVLWAIGLIAAISLSPTLAAVLLAPVAAVAALSSWRCIREADHEAVWLACACGGVASLAALAGPLPAVLAVLVAGGVLPAMTARHAPRAAQVKVALCAMGPAAGAASVVLADRQGVTECLILVGGVMLYDAANHLMGVGPTGGRLGALAGILTVGVLSILVAGVLVVPFSGLSPWVLCGLVALGAPASVRAAHHLVGGARLPAWRRLDALFLAGPAWVIGVALLLHP